VAISREKKVELISEITDKLKRSKSVVLTDYRGLTVEDTDEIRKQLREKGVDYKVIKNTLFKKALEEANLIVNLDNFEGHPIAAAFSYDDEVAPAKVTYEFSKKNENLEIVGGLLDGNEINAIAIKSLAKLPGKDELYAKLVGSIAAPMNGLVNVMVGNLRGLVNVLNAYKEQKSN
jgi:large subunit ribosomal protein L10